MVAQSLDFDFLSQDALANPWQFLVPIQEATPLFWSETQRAWLVTRLADFKTVHDDERWISSRIDIYLRDLDPDIASICPTVIAVMPRILSFLDAPDHPRLRRLMASAFSTRVVESMRETTREIVSELLDLCEERSDLDFMAAVAYELPSRVVMKIFGIPREYQNDLNVMANSLSSALGTSKPTAELMQAFETSTVRVFGILTQVIEELGQSPEGRQGNLLAALVDARDSGQRLSHDELLAAAIGVISAGFDTTAAALAMFTHWISTHPEILDYIRADPKNVRPAVLELLRYPGLVKAQTRIAGSDFDWHGETIRQGDVVFMTHCSANVDPRTFDRPFDFDPAREPGQSVSFGWGAHHCIGHLLAKMELIEFLGAAFARFDIAVTQQDFNYLSSYAFYSYTEMWTRFTPRALSAAEA